MDIGEVESIAFGGQGIVRCEGLVVFLPFTAVGDTVSYRIKKRKKNFAFGELIEVLKPSAERVSPFCPYFGRCSGCQLQHIQYEAQLKYKRQWIEDALTRQAGVSHITVPPVVPARQQRAYRRRIVLVLKPHKGHFQAGYTMNASFSLLPITQCPIFTLPPDPIIESVQNIAHALHSQKEMDGRVHLLKESSTSYILHFHFNVMPDNAKAIFEKAVAEHVSISGILATSPKQTLRMGRLETSLTIEGLHFTFSPRAFIQNHPEQSINIYRALIEAAAPKERGNVLDLYCGIGISSLLLARRCNKRRASGLSREVIGLRMR